MFKNKKNKERVLRIVFGITILAILLLAGGASAADIRCGTDLINNDPKSYWDCMNKENWGIENIGFDKMHERGWGNYGEGKIVAIIDSGIDIDHPIVNMDGKNNPVDWKINIIASRGPYAIYGIDDSEGHGTGIAGIIWEIAPKAKFIIIKPAEGITGLIDYEAGINFAVDNGANVIVTSICPSFQGSCYDEIAQYASDKVDSDTSFVAAAGNKDDKYPISPSTGVKVISVSSIQDFNDYLFLGGSPQNPKIVPPDYAKPDFAAPGKSIYTLNTSENGYENYISGSSFAAPHVAGALLLLQRMGNNAPTAETILKDTAIDVLTEDEKETLLDGKGRINLIPKTPILQEPEMDSHVNTLTPTYRWWPPLSDISLNKIKAYQIRVWEDSGLKTDGTKIVLEKTISNPESSQITPSIAEYINGGLVDGKHYHWHVRAYNGYFWSDWANDAADNSDHMDFSASLGQPPPTDTTPPTITYNTPTGSNIPANTSITITFSEAIDHASAESSFSISPSTAGSFYWNSNTMTYTPSSDLDYDATYIVSVGTNVKDLANNNLQSPYSWQFSTRSSIQGIPSYCVDFSKDLSNTDVGYYLKTVVNSPYCANNWHIKDYDGDGYDEYYLLVGETYYQWSFGATPELPGHKILNIGDRRDYDSSIKYNCTRDYSYDPNKDSSYCDSQQEYTWMSKKLTSPSDRLSSFPMYVTADDGSGSWYSWGYDSYDLSKTWKDANGNEVHEEYYQVLDNDPTFTLSLYESPSQSVAIGGFMSLLIDLISQGSFVTPVMLSCSGLPEGTSCKFSQNPAMLNEATRVTITTSNTTPRGSYTVVIVGTGGGETKTTNINLVIGSPNPNPATLTVCQNNCNYNGIQAAIDAANIGDMILVHSGTYQENVDINKQLTLRGQKTDGTMPIVDAGGTGSAIKLSANGITLEGFNASNSGGELFFYSGGEYEADFNAGINIATTNNYISNNNVFSNGIGILTHSSPNNNIISNNNIYLNNMGLFVGGGAYSQEGNIITGNNVYLNGLRRLECCQMGGIILLSNSNNIYQNNFFGNSENAIDNYGLSNNNWDNGIIGNHYSNFDENFEGCIDSDSNNICDSSYNIPSGNNPLDPNNVDRYPLVSLVLPTTPVIPTPITRTVCPSDCDYTRIQDALDAAYPGDTILVNSGTYHENADVNIPELILKGVDTGSGKPIVDAGGFGSPITISSNGITLEGFGVTNSEVNYDFNYAGIKVNSNNNKITNNDIFSNQNGVYLKSSRNNLINGNVYSNNREGIFLDGSDYNLISENIVISNGDGIYFYNSIENMIFKNILSANEAGIYLDSSNNNVIYQNNFLKDLVYSNGQNQWDYENIGNHYSNFDENFEGCIDSDDNNICDSSYNIQEGSDVDRYPLVSFKMPYEQKLTSLTLSPTTEEVQDYGVIFAGYNWDFFAMPKDQFGVIMELPVTWIISDPTVGTIEPITDTFYSGAKFTATGTGTAIITARSGSLTEGVNVTVSSSITTITISPAMPSVAMGNTISFTAKDQNGNDITSIVTWSSSNSSLGTFDMGQGIFFAYTFSPGITTITARNGEVSGSVSLSVIEPSGFHIESITGKGTVFLQSSAGTIQDMIAVDPNSILEQPPIEANLYYGLFRFNITGINLGGSITLTMTFPEYLPDGTTYWKYGENHNTHWYTIPSSINGNTITITLTDGGLGDDDLTANGIIIDDGGPSIPQIATSDTVSPITTAVLSGSIGNNGWYISDVRMNLTATDNLGGSGVNWIEYSLDNATWIRYTAPFNISSEGISTIYYCSTDNAGNVELIKSQTIKIDKTPPEAAIRFDISLKDFRVYNVETGNDTNYIILPSKKENKDKKEQKDQNEKAWERRQYALRDIANNSLTLILRHKKEGKEAEIEVISTQYNAGTVSNIAMNRDQVEYTEEKGLLNELEQEIEVKKLFDAKAKFSGKKDQTEISVKIEGKKEQKVTPSGIVLLELMTDIGSLKVEY